MIIPIFHILKSVLRKAQLEEKGSVTVIAMALCAVALIFAIGLSMLGGFSGVKAEAQNAADAASLSAAYEIAHFSNSKACTSAKIAANKNGAELISCDYTNNEVEVIVSIIHKGELVKAKARAEIK